MKIISGGQIGADIAGLRAAKELGIPTGGWMPKGFRTLRGSKPEYAELYNMKESSVVDYPHRTHLNVMMSDATIRFAYDWSSPGERLTRKECERQQKPFHDITMTLYPKVDFKGSRILDDADEWLSRYRPTVLNIAGNANQLIENAVEEFLIMILEPYK